MKTDDKASAADQTASQDPGANRRTDNTTPTLYPEVDFVNRTMP